MPNDSRTTVLQQCLDRWHQGDESARNDLLRHAAGRLTRLAHKMFRDFPALRRWEETDDVLQNALIRLSRALQDVPVPSVYDFFRLAALQIRRELLDLAKHYFGPHGPAVHDAGQPPPEPENDTHNPSRLAWWTEFHRQVEALPAPEKGVFDLIWYQELPQAEVADLLKVDVRTVKRRWLAARLKLDQALHGDLPGG
jgi:RNA polymerase sigma-70 factor (ECF subfamily)